MILMTLAVFSASLLNDILAVLFVRRVAQGKAIQAGFVSMGIVALGAITVLAWVQSPWYVAPTVLGAWFGTFLTTKMDHKRCKPF